MRAFLVRVVRFCVFGVFISLLVCCARDEEEHDVIIDSAEPRTITRGTLVTVRGDRFGEEVSDAEITLIADSGADTGTPTTITPEALTNDTITFLVPVMRQGSYGLRLSVPGGMARLHDHFSYTVLVFDDFSPRFLNVGAQGEITLEGDGFSTLGERIEVYLGDTLLSISSVTDSQIVSAVPSALPAGAYDLQIGVEGTLERLFPANRRKFYVRDVSVLNGELVHLVVDDDSPLALGSMRANDFQVILGFLQPVLGVSVPIERYSRDVAFYKVKYHTTYNGAEVVASAVVALPEERGDSPPTYPLHLAINGTIASDEQSASAVLTQGGNLLLKNPAVVLLGARGYAKVNVLAALMTASTGYVSVFPDGVGFGVSRRREVFHPYLHEASLATANLDAVLATKEFANVYLERFGDVVDVRASQEVYIAGYSEGAYAALATQKKIETEHADGLVVIASYVGGGPFLLEEVAKEVVMRANYESPFFIPYLYLAYQAIEGPQDYSVESVFQQSYAVNIVDLFDPLRNLSGDEINGQLTKNLTQLLTPDFKSEFPTGDGGNFRYLREDLAANSLDDGPWVPIGEIHIYHSLADELVSYDLAQQFAEQLDDRTKSLVSFIPLEGDPTHVTGAIVYFEKAMEALSASGGQR